MKNSLQAYSKDKLFICVFAAISLSSTSMSVFRRKSATLFLVSLQDKASLNIGRHLLELNPWIKFEKSSVQISNEEVFLLESSNGNKLFYLWMLDSPLLKLDCADKSFITAQGIIDCCISDAIFLSKHVAASGTASLTVHPIGIPWQAEASRSGGRPGSCSPPGAYMGALYREILKMKCASTYPDLQVTMEATHHGPYMEIPSCFVEIGSTEAGWDLPYAGQLWASCLSRYFGLPVRSPSALTAAGVDWVGDVGLGLDSAHTPAMCDDEDMGSKGVVVVGIGGGHYVPRMNDLARLGRGLFIGHTLASYTLERYFSDKSGSECVSTGDGTDGAQNIVADEGVPGGWSAIVLEAIRSTRITFPDQQLICMVDKKAFSARGRTAITGLLDAEGIAWTYKSTDVKKLWEAYS